MTDLGLWRPYINEHEMLSWYQLPDSLRADCQAFRPDGRELDPISTREFADLQARTFSYADQSVARFRPAYHNANHFRSTMLHGLCAADAYADGNEGKMPAAVRQAFGLALYTHDAHHCASTFRSEAPHGVYNPGAGLNVTSEWVTADAVNTFMRRRGLNTPSRLFQTGVIWASTYGAQTTRGSQMGIPNPQPATVWGAIMRAADVCPPDGFGAWLHNAIAVNYLEVPAAPAQRTRDAFVTAQKHFASYIRHCYAQMDAIAARPLSRVIGWQQHIDALERELDLLIAGKRRQVEVLQAELRKTGVTLD